MSGLTLFGLLGVTAMLVCYALEARSAWFVFGFAVACAWAEPGKFTCMNWDRNESYQERVDGWGASPR